MSDTVNYQLSKSAKSKSQSPVKSQSPIKPRVKSHSSQKSRFDLLVWKITKLKELVFNRQSMEEKGTPQRKVRWGRSGALKKSRLKRVRRDRMKRKISQRIDRQRRLKGRAQ